MLDLFGSSLVLVMATAGFAASVDVAVHFARAGLGPARGGVGPAPRAATDRAALILRPAFGAAR